MEVKILGISSSPRSGNTLIMVHEALKSAETVSGIKTELYSFIGKPRDAVADGIRRGPSTPR